MNSSLLYKKTKAIRKFWHSFFSVISDRGQQTHQQLNPSFGYPNPSYVTPGLHATNNSEEDLYCNICFKTFYSLSVYRHHMRSTHEDPKFKCPVCGLMSRRKHNLQRHLKNVHRLNMCFHCNQTYPFHQDNPHVCQT